MKKYTLDQIVVKLRQADVELSKGKTVKEVCRVIEITEQTRGRTGTSRALTASCGMSV